MQIEIQRLPCMSLEDFANQHQLRMRVVERSRDMWPHPLNPSFFDGYRFYAQFDGVEASEGHLLVTNPGNGPTPAIAIAMYARNISEKTLIVGARKAERREIRSPVLEYYL